MTQGFPRFRHTSLLQWLYPPESTKSRASTILTGANQTPRSTNSPMVLCALAAIPALARYTGKFTGYPALAPSQRRQCWERVRRQSSFCTPRARTMNEDGQSKQIVRGTTTSAGTSRQLRRPAVKWAALQTERQNHRCSQRYRLSTLHSKQQLPFQNQPHVRLENLRAVSSMVEHLVYTEGVRSSSLLPPNLFRDRPKSIFYLSSTLQRNLQVLIGM